MLATIPHNLGAEVGTALAELVPAPVGKIGLQFKRRFWEEDDRIFGGITDTSLDIGTIFYPSYGFHGGRGVVIGYYSYFADSETLAALSPRDRAEHALEQGARIHGDAYRDEFENAFSVHWQDQQYSDGGWIEWQQDRAESTAYATLLEPVQRLYFAGDHLSYVTAWQHGAIESARHVITQLHERVLSGSAAGA